MIQMPHRSVTRFFIPLIDVLLLLFCMFLLMPIAREADLDKERESAADLAYRLEIAESELERRMQELKKFEELRLVQADLEKIKEELDRLRKDARKPFEQKVKFYILDLGPKGNLSFFDGKAAEPKPLPIADKKSAHALIDKHKQEAKGRELYYYFLYPRPETGFPTVGQERQYKTWFADVGNSLASEKKEPQP